MSLAAERGEKINGKAMDALCGTLGYAPLGRALPCCSLATR